MQPFLPRLHTYLSFSGPHLGMRCELQSTRLSSLLSFKLQASPTCIADYKGCKWQVTSGLATGDAGMLYSSNMLVELGIWGLRKLRGARHPLLHK